jgi:hypothetical protein
LRLRVREQERERERDSERERERVGGWVGGGGARDLRLWSRLLSASAAACVGGLHPSPLQVYTPHRYRFTPLTVTLTLHRLALRFRV